MRPPKDELIAAYLRDLEIEVETNAREIAAGRTDLGAYDRKCRSELAGLQAAQRDGAIIGIGDFGVPSVEAGYREQAEALALIRAVVEGSRT